MPWFGPKTRGIAPIAFKRLRRGGASPHIGAAEPLVGPFGRAADRCTKTPVSLGALISGFAAPDVRRGFAPPVDGHLRLGCALRSRYALVWAKGRTRGIAPIAFKRLRRGGASPHIGAAEPLVEPFGRAAGRAIRRSRWSLHENSSFIGRVDQRLRRPRCE